MNGGCRQAVKTSDCGSDMHGFESHHPPHKKDDDFCYHLFYLCVFDTVIKSQICGLQST